MRLLLPMLATALLTVADPPTAPPAPPPIPPAGSSTPTPGAPADGERPVAPPVPGASSTVEAGPADKAPPPLRLWVVLDYYKEFGGTVVHQDEASITLRTPEGDERKVDRNSIVSAVPLLDDPAGTRVLARLRDGRTLRGELVRDDFDMVVVRIKGVATTLPRSAIFALERELPFETRLAQFRSRIPADAWDVRLELVRWLLEEEHPEIALEELRVIRRNSDSEAAADLMRRAEAECKLRQDSTPRADPDATAAPKREGRVERLTDADVNLVRVMEVDLADPPRMRTTRELASRLREDFANDSRMPPEAERARMGDWPATKMLALLFSLKARDLYGLVRVEEDPEHLRLFRRRVHDGWLVPNCATSRCHGGDGAGRFMLSNVEPGSARTAYTNLLILLAFRTGDGHPLIDFDQPERSVLLDMGRPRNEAVVPHPLVQGWQSTTKASRATLEVDAKLWIHGMHGPPRPVYPVQFRMPEARPTAPAGASKTDER